MNRLFGGPARVRSDAVSASEVSLVLTRMAHRNNLATMVVQIAASICLVLAAGSESRAAYYPWLAVVLLLSLARLIIGRAFARVFAQAEPDRAPGYRVLRVVQSASLLANAGLWALLAWWRLPIEVDDTRYVLAVILSGLAGGAIGILAPLRWTGRIYVSLILLPGCIRLLALGQPDSVLGGLGLVFWAVMMAGHRNNHELLVRSVELGQENRDLVEQLQERTETVEETNRSLEHRVAERTIELEQRAVEALAANRAKSEFLATISHEIRTPLNGVLGMAQIMERDDLAVAQRERLTVIQSSARVLLGVLNDVLDISRIEAGKFDLHPVDFDLHDFGEGVRRLYEAAAFDKGLVFSVHFSGDGGAWRRGDPVRLRQIVCNLVSNALKFTEHGYIRLDLRVDAETISGSVSDSGVGIASEHQARVFEKFVQGDASSTRQAGGSGLGLAICRNLVTLMGGELWLTSSPGQGSTFAFTVAMPAAIVPPTSEDSIAEPTLAASAPVLVVDDNPSNRLVLQTLLSHFGVASVVAANGREAVAAWEGGEWAAILMDIHMPEMDGIDATRAIRALELRTGRPRTPIIAVTASVLTHEADSYLGAGMDDVLPKPIEVDRLVETLNRQLEARRGG